jgi:hypothetical protein
LEGRKQTYKVQASYFEDNAIETKQTSLITMSELVPRCPRLRYIFDTEQVTARIPQTHTAVAESNIEWEIFAVKKSTTEIS